MTIVQARLLTLLGAVVTAVSACATAHIAVDSDVSVPDDGASDASMPDDAASTPLRDERIPGQAVVAFVGQDTLGPWWIEERLQGEAIYLGDHDLGPRSLVRARPERAIVWTAPDDERMTSAVLHPSGEWSAVGVDGSLHPFLARGDANGLLDRVTLDDPALATDDRAWLSEPPADLRVGTLAEAGVSVVADGEDVVVLLSTREDAVIAYRWQRLGDRFVRGVRTLVSPAVATTPYLPIGGSYDDFDAVASPYILHAGISHAGSVFVSIFTTNARVRRHNMVFGTDLDLLRDALYPRENTSDALIVRVDRDGAIGFSTVVGTPDVEDEIFGLTVGPDRVAVLGRSRRELGRDNTELHVMVAELDHAGVSLGTTTYDCAESGLAQAGLYDGDVLFVGGTQGWQQNPSGRSVVTPGHPFLVRLSGSTQRTIDRLDVPQTEGAAELRALARRGERLLLGGHENGPLTHTGDADRSLIRSDAWWAERPVQ